MVCVGVAVKGTMYQRKADVDMLNAVKSVLADISSVSPSSEQTREKCAGNSRLPARKPFLPIEGRQGKYWTKIRKIDNLAS